MAASNPQMARITSLRLHDGRGLCVRSWPGPGDPVVMLHGLLDSSEGWTDVAERLPCARIAVDLPGFGYSDPPLRGSIPDYARDVAEALELLGVQRCTLVGHSLGGAVAAALAELSPELVGALLLVAPAGFGRIRLAEAVSVPGVRTLVQAAMPSALSSRLAVSAAYVAMVTNGARPDPAVVERVTRRGPELVTGAREGTRAIVDAGRSKYAFHRRGLAYDGPVFAVWGDRDRLVPLAHRDGVRAALPQARIEVWRGMGHHAVKERFDRLMAMIERASTAAYENFERLDEHAPLADAA
jgi:pimeloyl-ACP methyl ester carboxylesterase